MSDKVIDRVSERKTADEYLLSERQSGIKNEYFNGRVVGRSGSNRWHNLLASNTAISLGSRMHGHKCEIYIGNMRVTLKNSLICYPDVVVVNGEPSFTDQNFDLLQNPTVVVDVFSTRTNASDKSKKLESFLETESIKECLLLKLDEMRVEHYSRQNAKQWIYRIYNERDDVISLDSINCKISLAEIYSQIKFRQPEFSSKAVN